MRKVPEEQHLPCPIALPKITNEMIDGYYPWLICDTPTGYDWNQAAVDFACLLKSHCVGRQRKQ